MALATPASARQHAPILASVVPAEQVNTLIPAWKELLNRVRPADSEVYSTPEYFLGVNRAQPWIVKLERDGELVGLAPFYLESFKFPLRLSVLTVGNIPAKRLRFLAQRLVLADGTDEESALNAILSLFRKTRPFFDYVYFECVPISSLPALRDVGCKLSIPAAKRQVLRKLRLEGTVETYIASLERGERYYFRNGRKKMNQSLGVLAFERITDPSDAQGFVEAVDSIFQSTWQAATYGYRSRKGEGTLRFVSKMAECGYLRSYVLRAQGKPIAFVIGYQFGGVFHYEEIGYDLSYAKHRPGVCLLHHIIEDLFQHDRPLLLDFGFGEGVYKKQYGNAEEQACSAYYTSNAKWQALFAAQNAADNFAEKVRDFARKWNLDARLRSLVKRKR